MDQDVAAGITSLWADHFEAQERRVAAQEQALVARVAGKLDDAGREVARNSAHKLAGSLGTFGFDEGSRLAAQIEAMWETENVAELASAVLSLRTLLESKRPIADSAPRGTAQVVEPLADVWLVDDDDVFARSVLEPLQRSYRVAWLSSGESALAEVARTPSENYPKVILLDIEMPGIKGLTVLEQLAHQGVVGRSAIVMLTRRSAFEDVVLARRLGAFDFLAKPIRAATLIERVDRALQTIR